MRALALAVALLLGLAGCATTTGNFEAPPEVIAQPTPKTTDEAVAEGEAAKEQVLEDEAAAQQAIREAEITGAEVTPDGRIVEPPVPPPAAPSLAPSKNAAPAAAMPVVATPATAADRNEARRFRPSELSTQEIRAQHAASPHPLDFNQRLDYAHDRVYTVSQSWVEATDRRWARKDEDLLPVPAAPFRLGTIFEGVAHSHAFAFDLDMDLDMTLKLPNTEKRMKVFITSSTLDESARTVGDDSRLRAGVRYEFTRELDFDLGVRVDWPPVAFASLKWSREVAMGHWSFYPLAKLFAETEDSVGYAAAATLDHWRGRRLLRSSTYTKRQWNRSKNEWSQTIIYARARQLLVPDRYGSYISANDIGNGWGIRLFGKDKGEYHDKNSEEYYEVGLFWRKPSKNRWLYWHVEPMVRWDRKYNWTPDPGVRLGFDMLFWDLARPAR